MPLPLEVYYKHMGIKIIYLGIAKKVYFNLISICILYWKPPQMIPESGPPETLPLVPILRFSIDRCITLLQYVPNTHLNQMGSCSSAIFLARLSPGTNGPWLDFHKIKCIFNIFFVFLHTKHKPATFFILSKSNKSVHI